MPTSPCGNKEFGHWIAHKLGINSYAKCWAEIGRLAGEGLTEGLKNGGGMMRVKKGDGLRYLRETDDCLTQGKVYTVIDVEDYGKPMAAFLDDDGDRYLIDEEAVRLQFEVIRAEYEDSRETYKRLSKPIDNVQSPSHYTRGRTEVIDVIEDAVQGAAPFEAVCQANVLKYVLRYRHKNGVEDLRKAAWYLERLIAEKDA